MISEEGGGVLAGDGGAGVAGPGVGRGGGAAPGLAGVVLATLPERGAAPPPPGGAPVVRGQPALMHPVPELRGLVGHVLDQEALGEGSGDVFGVGLPVGGQLRRNIDRPRVRGWEGAIIFSLFLFMVGRAFNGRCRLLLISLSFLCLIQIVLFPGRVVLFFGRVLTLRRGAFRCTSGARRRLVEPAILLPRQLVVGGGAVDQAAIQTLDLADLDECRQSGRRLLLAQTRAAGERPARLAHGATGLVDPE